MKASLRRLGLGIWILIFGGMGLAALGFSGQRAGAAFGWPCMVVGLVAVAVGVVLIWVRSRMGDRTDLQEKSSETSS